MNRTESGRSVTSRNSPRGAELVEHALQPSSPAGSRARVWPPSGLRRSMDEKDEKAVEPHESSVQGRDQDSDGHSLPPVSTLADPVDWSQYTLRKRLWRPEVTDFAAIVQAKYRGNGTADDPFIVQWLDHDPENPKSFSTWRKATLTCLMSVTALCVSLASSAYSGAQHLIIRHFHCSEEVFLLGLSLMVLGYAVGPLLWAPLSEAVGRREVFLFTLIFYVVWTSVCAAAQNIWSLIIFRFLAGTIGSTVFFIPSGQLADMYDAEQRGIAMAVFSSAPFLGPTLGPAIGGFLGDAAGWRWLMGFLALYAAVLTFFVILFIPETYAPVMLRERARLLSKVTGKRYATKVDVQHPPVFREVARNALIRPWALLFREPIVLLLTIYTSIIYGTLYLFFPAFPIVFEKGYGWNAGQGGLAFLGIMTGVLLGIAYITYDNRRYVRIHRETGGFAPPETRLPPVIIGGVFAIVGLAWFAATASPDVLFIVPILAGIPFGLGFMMIFLACTNYLVDSYVIYAASVLAANSILRSTFGAVFPLFAVYMYENLGVHWASAVPGFLALACFPCPILFYKYGEAIRRRCKYSAEAARVLDSLKSDLERQRSKVAEEDEQKETDEEETGVVRRIQVVV